MFDQIAPILAETRQVIMVDLQAHGCTWDFDRPMLHTKLHDLLMEEYDWTEDVSEIKTPTMLVNADADSILPVHMVA